MDKKVEELVELKVRETATLLRAFRDLTQVALGENKSAPEVFPVARQIVNNNLSHPDLALIDREKKLPEWSTIDDSVCCSGCHESEQVNMQDAGWKAVIPLAEA